MADTEGTDGAEDGKKAESSATTTSRNDCNDKSDRSQISALEDKSESAKKLYKPPGPFESIIKKRQEVQVPPEKKKETRKPTTKKIPKSKLGRAITPSMIQEWDQIITKNKKAAECPGCKKQMRKVTSLQQHVATCEEAGPKFSHVCQECSIGFLTKGMLADHQSAKHGQESFAVPSTSAPEESSPREVRGGSFAVPSTATVEGSSPTEDRGDAISIAEGSSPRNGRGESIAVPSTSTTEGSSPRDDGGESLAVPTTSGAEGSPREGRGARVKKPVNRDIPEYPSKTKVNKDKQAKLATTAPTNPTRRPVGRPRKSKDQDDANSSTTPTQREVAQPKISSAQDSSTADVDLSHQLTRKPRGRPRKSLVPDDTAGDCGVKAKGQDDANSSTTPAVCQSKISSAQDSSTADADTSDKSACKSRGRPRKSVALDDTVGVAGASAKGQDDSNSPTTPKQGVEGQAKISSVQDNSSADVDSSCQPTRKRRGRPRKSVAPDDTVGVAGASAKDQDDANSPTTPKQRAGQSNIPSVQDNSAVDVDSSCQPTRKPRGRPRKSVAPDDTVGVAGASAKEQDDANSPTTPKQRVEGQFKKSSAQDSSTADVDSSHQATRKPRGRPRKSVAPGDIAGVTVATVKDKNDSNSSTALTQGVLGQSKISSEQESSPKDVDMSHQPTHKPRGRPRKSSAPDDTAAVAGPSGTRIGVRSRGKKVKYYADYETEFNESDEDWSVEKTKGVTSSRGRGKGKKKEVKLTSDSEDDNDESDDEFDASESPVSERGKGKGRRGSMAKKRKDAGKEKGKDTSSSPHDSSRCAKRKRRGEVSDEEESPSKKMDTESGKEDSYEVPETKKRSSLPLADQKRFAKEILQWEKEFEQTGYVFANCAKCHLRRRSMATLVKHYKICITNQPESCQKCGREFQSSAGLKYHMMAEHNVIIGNDVDESASLKLLLRKTGRLKCQREGCNKRFQSVSGYLMHGKNCGNNTTWDCEPCHKTYTSIEGLRYHKKTVHRVIAEPVVKTPPPPPELDAGLTNSGRTKRKAASRALQTLKDITQKTKTVVTEGKRKSKIRTLYISPKLPEELPKLVAEWTKALQKGGSVTCPSDGCTKEFTAVSLLKAHYLQFCKWRPEYCRLKFSCKLCDKVTPTVMAIRQHVGMRHAEEIDHMLLQGKEDGDSDSSGSSEFHENGKLIEEVEQEEEDYDDIEMEGEEVDFNKESADGHPTKRKGATPGYLAHPRVLFLKGLQDAIQWTNQQRIERLCHPSVSIFQDLRCSISDWHQLQDKEREDYEPVTKESVPMRVESLPAEVDETFHRLHRYAVLPQKSYTGKQRTESTFFVGGPVWAMAWCPVPQGQKQANQYAVISCHRTMDETHKVCDAYQGPGMLQLWNFGKLTYSGANSAPQFSMGIAHDHGCVWDLKWCPSGCWEDPGQRSSDGEEAGQSSEVRGDARLGLLGMACSDGTVRVLCVPHPKTDEDFSEVPIYKPIPALSLLPCVQHGQESAPWFGQCWCLEWLPSNKHTKIVASFSNGTVVLWDLCTTSSLLHSPTDGTVLYPIQTIAVCDFMIRSLTWCPQDPNYIGVVCSDKWVSIWDLRDTAYPVMKHSSSLFIDCKWLSHWAGFLASVDNSLLINRTYSFVAFHECGYYGFSTFVATMHKSCIWSLDVSDWLNGVTSVDSGGDAELMLLLPMCYDMEWVKNHHVDARKRSIYFTELEKLSLNDKEKVVLETISGRSKQSQQAAEDSSASEQVLDITSAVTGISQDSLRVGKTDGIGKDSTNGESVNVSTSVNSGISPEKRTTGNLTGAHAIEVDVITREQDTMMDVAVETQIGDGGVAMEIDRMEEVHDGNTSVPSDGVGLGKDDAPPIVIKTEPIDPEEFAPTEGTNVGDIVVDPSHNVQSQENNTSNVLVGDRTAPPVQTIEENTGVEFQDEIAQLLQVCQEVQESLTDPGKEQATPSTTSESSALDNKHEKSPGKGGKTGSQGKTGKKKTTAAKSKVGNKQQSIDRLPRTYQEMADDYGLVYHDIDMSHFSNAYKLGWKARSLPRLKYAQGMKEPPPDQFPLQALHKICMNPNYGSHLWVLTAGQAGIVRAHCMVGLRINSYGKDKVPST